MLDNIFGAFIDEHVSDRDYRFSYENLHGIRIDVFKKKIELTNKNSKETKIINNIVEIQEEFKQIKIDMPSDEIKSRFESNIIRISSKDGSFLIDIDTGHGTFRDVFPLVKLLRKEIYLDRD